MIAVVTLLSLIFMVHVTHATEADVPLRSMQVDLKNHASLQRGAALYMNYCAGCHSLQYVRYGEMARDIGITDYDGQVYTDLVLENLIFPDAKLGDPIHVAMPADDAKQWFGVEPPDLSLMARIRGADWLYTYLTSFYSDPERPLGANNWLFPDVAMPNVLLNLQGAQIPVYREDTIHYDGEQRTVQVVDDLQLLTVGSMHQHEFDNAVQDLVNFLVYVAEPVQLQRKQIGRWVLLFLAILLGVMYALKRSFWDMLKD